MNSTVREHVERLKSLIDLLTQETMDDRRTQAERKRLREEVGIAFLALAHYEAALREEHKLLCPNKPSGPINDKINRPRS